MGKEGSEAGLKKASQLQFVLSGLTFRPLDELIVEGLGSGLMFFVIVQNVDGIVIMAWWWYVPSGSGGSAASGVRGSSSGASLASRDLARRHMKAGA